MWNNLKASIAAVVRTNNNQEITGANLQSVLNTIVNSVGANATFAGIAIPSTNPGTPDGPVFYIAYEPGVYSNFNITTVDGLYILENKTGSWVGTRISTIGTSGTTFTPHVDSDGNLSWTNDGGKQNPETVNIKGPQGDTVILGEGEIYKLYNSTGQNTDGAMTQKAVTELFESIEQNFVDRAYVETTPNVQGNMGYKILRKGVTFASQVTDINTIYEIQYDYDLNGQAITLPAGCVLKFNGGSVSNGTLVGKLLSTEPLDFKNFGVKYGSASYAASNATALNILSGVTNDITLQVSGEVWIGGNTPINLKSINLEGNGNTIHIDEFSGFYVADGVAIRNCKVVTEEWDTAKSTSNVFVKVQNVTHPIGVLFENNYFKGSMRIVSGFYVADGVTENNEFVSTNYNICYSFIVIRNNIFEEICCGYQSISNVIFDFSDSNIINVNIEHNIVRNFFAEFVNFGITNNSIYESYIQDFYENVGRSFSVTNNQVTNDLDFKPWEKIDKAAPYFCFILAEKGIFDFSDNAIANIIGNDVRNPTYDVYLSVDVLTYENNIIKNVINIAGTYNEILKSKSGVGQKIRKYVGNRFTLEDVSEEFNVDITSLTYFLVNTGSVIQNYVIEKNVINFCTLTLNISYNLQADNLYIQKNVINVGKAITEANRPVFFPIDNNCLQAFIEDNAISVDYNTKNPAYLFGAKSSSLAKVKVTKNSLVNVSLYNSTGANYNVYGKCSDNTYSLDRNAILGTDAGYAQNGQNTNIVFVDNEVALNNFNAYLSICYNLCPYELKINLPTYHRILPAYRINANKRIIVKIKNENKEIVALSEFLINMADDVTAELTAYDNNGILVNGVTTQTDLYNFAGNTSMVQINNRNFRLINLPNIFYLSISLSDVMSLEEYPKSGVSLTGPVTLTPPKIGSTYFNTVIGKMLFWNGANWMDAAGAPAIDSLPYITDGLVFYVDGISKGYDDGSWLDLIGGLKFIGTNVIGTLKGFSFNGSSSGFLCENVLGGSANYTIEVCFKSDAYPNPFCLFASGDNTQYNLMFYKSNNNVLLLQRANTYPIALTDGQGYSISLNLDRGLVNGMPITIGAGTDYWANNNTYIGRTSAGRYYAGEIYAIRVYNRKLTEAEQRENFAVDNERFELGISL